ncbi:MAG: hypothetical protein ACD_77C00511G0004 [uncultured bacterium]|nr:MAG: hypothetical protein ACD_77C00511G0004 [uncultured bacterium]
MQMIEHKNKIIILIKYIPQNSKCITVIFFLCTINGFNNTFMVNNIHKTYFAFKKYLPL